MYQLQVDISAVRTGYRLLLYTCALPSPASQDDHAWLSSTGAVHVVSGGRHASAQIYAACATSTEKLWGAVEDAQFIPAALPPTEVIYFLLATDSTNQPLDASTGANYTITFPLPLPAKAFW